jgi:hypothetical protein
MNGRIIEVREREDAKFLLIEIENDDRGQLDDIQRYYQGRVEITRAWEE